MFLSEYKIDHRALAQVFTNIGQHKTVNTIIRSHSSNKLDVRNFALDGLQLHDCRYALDLGCGFGFFTSALTGRLNPNANILGIDLCTGYKTAYLDSCREAGIQGKFTGLDETAIKSIPENSIDLVICSYSLYFFPEIIRVISGILKPSGVFVIITHSKNHLTEIVTFIRETIGFIGHRTPKTLPCQNLIENFNSVNGYGLLAPWFGQVREKEYLNTLQFKVVDFEELEKYLKFKKPYYIPGSLDNQNTFFDKIIRHLYEYVQSGKSFIITKDDAIFICKEPLA